MSYILIQVHRVYKPLFWYFKLCSTPHRHDYVFFKYILEYLKAINMKSKPRYRTFVSYRLPHAINQWCCHHTAIWGTKHVFTTKLICRIYLAVSLLYWEIWLLFVGDYLQDIKITLTILYSVLVIEKPIERSFKEAYINK